MIFTLYYMYATFVQWWRLGALKNKIAGTLNTRNALMVCTGNTISDTKSRRSLENLLFHNGDRIGCTVVPRQTLNLIQWASFPVDAKCFPIRIKNAMVRVEPPFVYVLLQARLDPYVKHESEILQIEKFGEVVGWRALDHFELILKTNVEYLTRLIHVFSNGSIDINHELQLIKLETVDVEGKVTKVKYIKTYPKEQVVNYSYAPVHWKSFVREVRELYGKVRDQNKFTPSRYLLNFG